jgi:acyl-CoA thioesterase
MERTMKIEWNASLKGVSPFAESLGVQIIKFNEGLCQCSIEIKDYMLNIHRSVHGGVIYSLADIGMGAALYSALQKDERCSTIEIKINYLKPAFTDKLICDAKVLQKGKSIAVLESEIKSEDSLIAKAMGTFSIFLKKE